MVIVVLFVPGTEPPTQVDPTLQSPPVVVEVYVVAPNKIPEKLKKKSNKYSLLISIPKYSDI